ncbi:DNA polymerase III subunit beta [Numidum massiliense]|uniref:DNA polymerase III subunit beta n=1 Tax=Numidum massiliense TaxID=1522315 RepID=UPI0006D54A3E|nr:DNA polymerase III subunit beta [Numidum massiliense]
MKFSIRKQPLVEAVSHVTIAVSAQTTTPILTGIKLTVEESHCTLTASDSNISVQVEIPQTIDDDPVLEVEQTGSIVLPARLFSEIVRKLPGHTVEIEVHPQYTTTIRSGQADFQLNGMNANEFPRLPRLVEDKVFSLPNRLLKAMIRQTSFAVSTTESRPILTGVLWQLEEGNLRFVATDSHRLAQRDAQVEVTGEHSFHNVVVPGKSLSDLNKILEDDDELADVVVADNQLLVKSKHILFYSRLLEGNYPDTSRIIPQSGKIKMVLDTRELLNSIDRAAVLTKAGKDNVVKLETDDQKVEISAHTPEIGRVSESVQVKEIEGEPLHISFNAKFMMDVLRVLDSGQIRIEFIGPMAPFVIVPTDGDHCLYLILPVRTY